jgi:hypothetical protein
LVTDVSEHGASIAKGRIFFRHLTLPEENSTPWRHAEHPPPSDAVQYPARTENAEVPLQKPKTSQDLFIHHLIKLHAIRRLK